ncbi:hypothetical protein BH10CYA1_BH10CYA1_64610 [soil metagenome]
MVFSLTPLLTEKDDILSSEGGIDPLGLYQIADALAGELVPGVRERQKHPRFLTAIAVSLAICAEFEDDIVASDGVSEPWQIFEWYLVEGLVRKFPVDKSERLGLPGSDKAVRAISDRVPLSAKRYLKTPSVFGYHGVYRSLARKLRIEQSGQLGDLGLELISTWAQEQKIEGFIGTIGGAGQEIKRNLVKAVASGIESGGTCRKPGWAGWDFFSEYLRPYGAGKRENKILRNAILGDDQGFRRETFECIIADKGLAAWEKNKSERQFHQVLRQRANDRLGKLLDAIDTYETFARLCQDAFDDCLYLMTEKSSTTSLQELSNSVAVQKAAKEVPILFLKVLQQLEPFGQLSIHFRNTFEDLCDQLSTISWVERLIQHHERIQDLKPPEGKNSWFELWDKGLIVRPLYRRDKGGRHDDTYVHGYRTHSLWSFAKDLQLI